MENRYKIKDFPGVKSERIGKILTEQEVIDSFNTEHATWDSKSIPFLVNSGFIEKVEERIELEWKIIPSTVNGKTTNYGTLIVKGHNRVFTEQERILCEKALNGELVEKEKGTMKTIEETVCNGIYNPGNGTTYYTKMHMDQSIPISDCSDETISIKNTDETIQAQMDKRGAY